MPDDIKKGITYYKMGKSISIDQHIKKFTQPSENWYSEDNFLHVQPGKKFDYTNLDAVIAARIVEIKSGMSFDEYTRKNIFEPLKMHHTNWNYKDLDAFV